MHNSRMEAQTQCKFKKKKDYFKIQIILLIIKRLF